MKKQPILEADIRSTDMRSFRRVSEGIIERRSLTINTLSCQSISKMMFNVVLLALLSAAAAFSPMRVTRYSTKISMGDKPKMPAPPTIPKSEKTVGATVAGSAAHTTLLAALKAAKLDSVLDGAGTFVIFAPTDEAFKKLPAGTVDALLKDIPKLTDILKYHVTTNTQQPTRNGRAYYTLALHPDGEPKEVGVRVTVDTAENFILGGQANKAKVLSTIQATNGYVHVIDEVRNLYVKRCFIHTYS